MRDHIPIRCCLGEHFAQLLDNPSRRRVSGNVEVQDPPTSVLDDKEAVEQPERLRRQGEEVEGDNGSEKAIEASQWRARPSPFEHGDLLAQREDFNGAIRATAEENANCS
jgi:hypothetical protein